MGIGLWLLGGFAAFLIARIVPLRRPEGRLAELALALLSALILGLAATAMDFGGWKELDVRAGAFVLPGALAVLGLSRLVRR